jgi:hypothetical protein
MSMKSMSSGSAYSGYNSDNGVDYTSEWDFAPSYTVAQVSLYGLSGGGLHHAGVISYRYRPDPNGQDIIVGIGDPNNWGSWAPYIYVDQCTGVTFGAAGGAEQDLYVLVNLFFW